MPTLIAYHGDAKIKSKYLARVKRHREADELIQGYGYWSDGKGCAVGCAVHADQNPHQLYESELGIPERIAYLEDAIFEGLPVDKAREWPERFLGAVNPGADLSLVWHQFAVWLLRDSGLLTITDVNRDAISVVISLHVRGAAGDQPTSQEWSAAMSAAMSAAWSAADSSWSAARSAADSAWSAADSAWSAAWSAADSAWSAADSSWSAAYETMADKLIELISSAPEATA